MMPLIDVQLNAVTHEVIMKFMEIANFDIIPVENLFPEVFDMPDGEAFNDVLESFDFDAPYFIYNVGSPFIIMILVFALILSLFIIEYTPKCRNYRLKRIQKFFRLRTKGIHGTMFWSTPISILQETFMIVLFSLLVHLMIPHMDPKRTFGQKLNNWTAYIFTVLYIVGPIGCIVLLFKKFNRLGERSFT